MKGKQLYSKVRLGKDSKLTKNQIVDFLDDFQSLMQGNEGNRKLISLRVPEKLLKLFQDKAKQERRPYQTQIVELMRKWVRDKQ